MASTFTDDKLNLELMATGEKSGTWGGIANDDLTQIALALRGEFAVPLTNSDVTISLANCANMVLNCTGILSGNCAVKVQQKRGVYIVKNATTGSFSVTVKTTHASSTGIVVPQGKSAFLWCDGTHVYDATSMSTLGALAYLGSITSAALISDGIITFAKVVATEFQAFGTEAVQTNANVGTVNNDATMIGLQTQFTGGTTINLTLLQDSSLAAFSIGKVAHGKRAGAGALNLVAGTNVTINSYGSRLTVVGQHGHFWFKKVAANTYDIWGDLI